MELGLSYDDVLLVPKKSGVTSRKEVSTETFLTKKIKLKIPLLSANMDTITEANMAIAIAELGGIGIIHRFLSIYDQAHEVLKVKRYRNAVIKNPYTIKYNSKLSDALKFMKDKGVKSLLVVSDDDKLTGILTSRDLKLIKNNYEIPISEIMAPRERLVVSSPDISIGEADSLMVINRVEKLPLINPDWTIAGLITKKDIEKQISHPNSSLDSKGRLLVGAAIGVKEDALQRARALIEAGADILVIDIAHGHSDLAINTLKKLKSQFPNIPVIAGNVCTAEGTKELIEVGADAVKVGVGGGSVCTTRIITGAGFPQLSAITNCAREAGKYGIPIIADGGIRSSGDITKAIAAGASTAMIGRLFSGTDQSPGIPIVKDNKKYKVIRGMASFGAKLGREERDGGEKGNGNKSYDNIFDFIPEGVEAMVPYAGSVSEIIYQLIGGLKSGMSYAGAKNIEEIRGNAEFVQITSAGLKESHAHDVESLS
ncbi:IMP dehydrogenase [Candidatus Pacearchaeota archaeon]|nr:IMP dehydrogenase [Candidatus Pacearchaeota archaeon]